MSPALDRLTALAVAFLPERAEALLALVSAAPGASDQAASRARRPRRDRLAALAAAFAPALSPGAAHEPAATHPLWRRLTLEVVANSARPGRSTRRTSVHTEGCAGSLDFEGTVRAEWHVP